MRPINGVVPVIPIPFDAGEEIDEVSLRRTVDWVATQGLSAMCLPAYGSEFYKLSEGERERVVGIAIEASAGRTPIMAQANHGSAKIAAETARRYERLGAVGIMPGVPLADLLQRVFLRRQQGKDAAAYDLFAALLPFINFTLQDFELFLQVEKRLMVRRGLFAGAHLRQLTLTLSPAMEAHVGFLIDQIMRVIEGTAHENH